MRTISAIACLCIVGVAGCGPSRSPSSTPLKSAPSAAQQSTDFSNIPGEFPIPPINTDNGQSEAPVGGCVNLIGPGINALLKLVDCGSPLNTYRIIQRVNTPQECVSDSDRTYYHNSKQTGQFTACLDLVWDGSSCISLGQPVTKVACNDPGAPKKIKPLKVVLNTINVDDCPSGGYPHPVRRFAICTEIQKQ